MERIGCRNKHRRSFKDIAKRGRSVAHPSTAPSWCRPSCRRDAHTLRVLYSAVVVPLAAVLSGCHRRPGLEETGYTAFVFTIDTSSYRAEEDLAAAVAEAVLNRLGREGRYGIVSVPIGANRISPRRGLDLAEVRNRRQVGGPHCGLCGTALCHQLFGKHNPTGELK